MASTKPTVRNQVNVITLKCAQEWHKTFKDQNNSEGFTRGELPTSIVIPFASIEQIVNDINSAAGVTVNGVRLYFIIKPGVHPSGKAKVTGIIVPTKGPRLDNPDGIYEDMILNATLKAGAPKHPDCRVSENNNDRKARIAADGGEEDGGEEGYSSIYDFTRPCPPYCDPGSDIVTGSE